MMNDSLADMFRKLRESWFNSKLLFTPHEREWEDETKTELRERDNAKMKSEFDEDTEALIRGEDRPISPRCWADFSK